MNIKEYKKLSVDFNDIASALLRTKYTDGNTNLIRFKNYINENEVIQKIIQDKIINVEYDFNNMITIGFSGWAQINIPVNEAEHIKGMYDYLNYLADNNINLENIAFQFRCGGNNVNDHLRYYIDLFFKPLIFFISKELSKKIIELEEDDKMRIDISHTNGSVNIADRGSAINSTMIINNNDLAKIIELINSIKNGINNLDIDNEEKESIIDDMEIIDEQVNESIPKPTRFKKAFNNIKNFISNAALVTGAGVTVATNINLLLEYLKPIIDNLHL